MPNFVGERFPQKGCRLFSSVRNSHENVSPHQLKVANTANKCYIWGTPCLCSARFITTLTNKLTVSSLRCVRKIGHVGKSCLLFRGRHGSKNEKHILEKSRASFGGIEHLHFNSEKLNESVIHFSMGTVGVLVYQGCKRVQKCRSAYALLFLEKRDRKKLKERQRQKEQTSLQ